MDIFTSCILIWKNLSISKTEKVCQITLQPGWIRAEHTPLKSFTDDSSSLEILVQAQCKTIQFSHTLSRSDYYDSSKCPSNPTATYTMSYKVYAVHNLDDETDYYLVEQEGMYPFKNVCAST